MLQHGRAVAMRHGAVLGQQTEPRRAAQQLGDELSLVACGQRAWMVQRSEIVNLGGLWLDNHGVSVRSETLGLSSRVRRAAPSLHTQSEKPLVASHGLAKSAL